MRKLTSIVVFYLNIINLVEGHDIDPVVWPYYILIPLVMVLAALALYLVWDKYPSFKVCFWYSNPVVRMVRCPFKSQHQEESRPYDIFVSYSGEDDEYVEGELVPKLEDSNGDFRFRCLVHVRDFVPGRTIIEQIVQAVKSSKCLLVVLSKDFAQSTWARQE